MPRERRIRLEIYNISREKYLELKYFCRQYHEKRLKLEEMRDGYKPIVLDSAPKAKSIGNPTQVAGISCARLSRDIEDIEQAAIEACGISWPCEPSMYQYMIRHVTDGISIDWLDAPCGFRQFTEARRVFYYLLAERRDKCI